MRRESLNITISESLRKAQIRQRLDTMADHTGLTATQIAGRALTIGLGLIESDLQMLFPGQPSTSAAIPSSAPTSAAQPSTATPNEAQPCAATHSTDTQHTATASAAQPDAAEPSAPPSRFVPTAEVARALGYRDPSAFFRHCQRHPELKKHSRKQGRVRLWNLAKLRSEYERQGWQPK